ncbi:heme A synthase [Oceanicella actignis]|uniref:heme A synthase n=1 Tax=Oceanicella actignis TaxID=1189325 RepID=UPI0011E731FF|nr:heme A synthase [Oceanicella actignis]TYO85231.1 cytochrome c oxidase assembly protein subunit 15 [Oceanicella actignis]
MTKPQGGKPRAIFEEAGPEAPAPAPAAPGAEEARRRRARRFAFLWTALLAALVAAMVLVGGLTRLTDSGLSITEWRPVTGAIPPLSEADWQDEFRKYQASPEYQLAKRGMSMDEFKFIYWWEWGHRVLGRLVGLVWAAGLAWMLARRAVPPGWLGRFVLVGALGGVQGAIGWWMVASGLTGRMVDVASYRLAIHLGMAFAIFGLLVWMALQLRRDPAELLQARRRRLGAMVGRADALLLLAFAQILLGALVAGIDAGRGYIDWPLMNGEFLPSESFDYEPLWSNFFENPALVQFNHRMVGYLLVLAGLGFWLSARGCGHEGARRRAAHVALALAAQATLGVATVMHAAPLSLALAHQLGALAVFALILRARFEAAFPAREGIARPAR